MDADRLTLRSLHLTCSAFPSQWEGRLEDGRMIYVRYRWGYLSVRVSPGPTEEVGDAVLGEEVFGQQLGGDLDGRITWDRVLLATGSLLRMAT